MSMSFHEKSLWLLFASVAAIFAGYFAIVLPTDTPDVQPQHAVVFVVLLILLVVIQAVGNSVLAILDRRYETDERDRLIELEGARNGSYVLATGAFVSICAALFTSGNFLFTHLLLGFWVLATLVEIGSQLWQYRRDA